ncbi:hypothetical protein WA158_000339 [Blastocystis sp. Blastoise]
MTLMISPPSAISATPPAEMHASLGLNEYVQITSPLRRYNDMISHRQLKAFLYGEPLPYSEEDITYICKESFEREREAKRLQKHYGTWLLLKQLESVLNRKNTIPSLKNNIDSESKEEKPVVSSENTISSISNQMNGIVLSAAIASLEAVSPRSSMLSLYVEDLRIILKIPTYNFPPLGSRVAIKVTDVSPDSNRIRFSLPPPYGDDESIWYRVNL